MADKANDDQSVEFEALMQAVDTLSESVLAIALYAKALGESHARLTIVCDMLAEKTGLTQDEVDAELGRREDEAGPDMGDNGVNGQGDLPPECWN